MALLRPGINTTIRETEVVRPAPTDTGVAYIVGMFKKGPVGVPIELHDDNDAEDILGGEVNYSQARGEISLAFGEGAGTVYASRFVGPGATKAHVAIPNTSNATTANVYAADPGADFNGWTITVTDGDDDDITIVVKNAAGVTVETSPSLGNETESIAWGETSTKIDIVDVVGTTGAFKPGTYTLAGGSGDEASAGNTQLQAARDVLTYNLGPGQVCAPGYATSTVTAKIAEHAADRNRYAIADAPAVSVDDLVAYADTVRAAAGTDTRQLSLVTPQVITKSNYLGRQAIMPASGVVAGIIARSDQSNSPGTPVANLNGISRTALDVTVHYTPDEITRLVAAGYTVLINRRGRVMIYSDRTAADVKTDDNWYEASDARTIMSIRARGEAFLEALEITKMDGKGKLVARATSGLRDILSDAYDDDDLYGATFEDAFSLSVIQHPTTRSLEADVGATCSQSAEQINFSITKRRPEEA